MKTALALLLALGLLALAPPPAEAHVGFCDVTSTCFTRCLREHESTKAPHVCVPVPLEDLKDLLP